MLIDSSALLLLADATAAIVLIPPNGDEAPMVPGPCATLAVSITPSWSANVNWKHDRCAPSPTSEARAQPELGPAAGFPSLLGCWPEEEDDQHFSKKQKTKTFAEQNTHFFSRGPALSFIVHAFFDHGFLGFWAAHHHGIAGVHYIHTL